MVGAETDPDLEHITVTISNNGPNPATNVLLVVSHPLADVPFEHLALPPRRRC